MKFFDTFLPVYTGWKTGSKITMDYFHKRYDKQREIGFGHFRGEAQTLRDTANKLDDHHKAISNQVSNMAGVWKGMSADAAQQYCKTYLADAQKVHDDANHAADLIDTAWRGVEKACVDKA